MRKLLAVTAKYSAAVVQDVTVTLNSGAGTAYDTLLKKIEFATETDGVWVPDRDIVLQDDDTFDVVAPAGGAGVTSAITISTEVL